jgi:hypothetical protein
MIKVRDREADIQYRRQTETISSFAMTSSLPQSLKYMQPFIDYLKSLPADGLNEDVDPELLEDALRIRLANGKPHETLEADIQLLDTWLASFDSSAHPAHWIAGYLLSISPEDLDASIAPAPIDPELERIVGRVEVIANRMLEPGRTVPTPPSVIMDVPDRWTFHVAPGMSELRHGESKVILTAINQQFFEMMCGQYSAAADVTLPVAFGQISGLKFRYTGSEMANVSDYLLKVGGRYVRIRLSLQNPEDDEEQIEKYFESLNLSP